MSEEQQRFETLMKRVIKVSPEELKRRMAESKIAKKSQDDLKRDGDNK